MKGAMLGPLKRIYHAARDTLPVTPDGRAAWRALRLSRVAEADPGPEAVIAACLDWLGVAQDNSASRDGGVARDFDLRKGWAVSYPETTGYIVATLLEQAATRPELETRARAMLDWLCAIQFENGAFAGGVIGAKPWVPVTFNTGQILIGLAAGAARFGAPYLAAMHRAADWLAATLEADGCWRRFPTPFAEAGEKAYETHVAMGLFVAHEVAPGRGYAAAGLRNVHWALTQQQANGWLDRCCLDTPEAPLTHTLGYALRGLIEGVRVTGDADALAGAVKLADGLGTALAGDGFLPGRLGRDWRGAVPWACMTGTSQIAESWFRLARLTGNTGYRDWGRRANAYVRRRVRVDGPPELRGAVPGAFPIGGQYGRYQFLNWAAKFTIDAQAAELAG